MNKRLVQIKDAPYIYIDRDIFTGNIEEVGKKVLGIKDLLKQQINVINKDQLRKITAFSDYKEIKIRSEDDYDSNIDYSIEAYREETDEEYNNRLEKEKRRSENAKKGAKTRKEAALKREKTLYENLKKKYEQ